MSINNVSAVSDAIKYLQGQEIRTKNSSILSPVKDAVTSPLNLVFAVGPVKRELKDVYTSAGNIAAEGEKVKLFDAFRWLKGAKIGENGIVQAEVVKDGVKELVDTNICASKSLKQQLSHAVNQLAKGKPAKQAAEVAVEEAGKKGILSTLKNGLKTAKGAIKTFAGKIPVVSKFVDGTAKSVVKKGIGKVFGEKGLSMLSKAKGVFKGSGAGVVAVIDGGIETFTQVIPAFKQGGAKAGFKQIAKSGTKVAAGAGGWAAGSAIGKGVGAWLGGIIGGIFGAGAGAAPGAAIGGAIGNFLGGIIGSGVASKVAEKITGKSETEKIQEQTTQEAAQEIANSPEQMQQLKAQLEEQVNADIQSGNVTENTEIIANHLNSGAFGSSSLEPSNPTPTQAPSFTVSDPKNVSNNTNWIDEEFAKIQNGTQQNQTNAFTFKGKGSENTTPINFYG